MFHVVSQLVGPSQKTLRLIDLYIDRDLHMQISDLVSHFHLYHITDLALNGRALPIKTKRS